MYVVPWVSPRCTVSVAACGAARRNNKQLALNANTPQHRCHRVLIRFKIGISLQNHRSLRFQVEPPIATHLQNRLVHQRWPTEVELNVLRCIVVRQLVFNDRIVRNRGTIALVVHVLLHLPVVFLSRLGKHHVEIEIRELRCDFIEIVQVEQLRFERPPYQKVPCGPSSTWNKWNKRAHGSHAGPRRCRPFPLPFLDEEFTIRS